MAAPPPASGGTEALKDGNAAPFLGRAVGAGGGGMFGVSVKNLCRRRLPSLTPLPIQCPTP
jgi:hypothetical protein